MSGATSQGPSGRGRPSAHDTGTSVGADDLARRLSDLARTLEVEDDPEETLRKVVERAIALVPGAYEGSISVVTRRRKVASHAQSGTLPEVVDWLQNETGEGPCLDAIFEQQTVRVPDIRSDPRWPRLAARAAQAGATGMLAFQLYVDRDNLGALNLYSRRPGEFDDESEHVGLMLAAHAAVAFAGVRKQRQLTFALSTRDLIGQAKGILMERHKITGDQAFLVLAQASRQTNHKLRDVADELVRSGELVGRREAGRARREGTVGRPGEGVDEAAG